MPPDLMEEIVMTFLYIVLGVIIVFVAFKINLWLGLGLIAALTIYGIYHFIPTFYVTKGNQAYAAGDEEASREWYKKAYDTGRMNVKMKSSYAYILLRTGHEDEAEKILDPIIRVKRLAPEKKNLAKQQRCMVYYRQGRIKEALEEAMDLYESGYRTSNLYGMIGYFKLLSDAPVEETLKMCEEAYDYDKDNRDILDNLSICYYRLNRYEDAEKISDELLAENDNFIEGYYHGAQIALKRGNYKKAQEYLDKLSECKRSKMTTITEEEIEVLRQEIRK
ncbi:MAG: tetratricopeptide repeat protein [Oscillospiraceae bacterium]|nr:tetratricopeptide repeat protein [Oscillospiraceae bacterium]